MLSFQSFLTENTKFQDPSHDEDHDEVTHQLENDKHMSDAMRKIYSHLSNIDNYKSAMSTGRGQMLSSRTISKIGNTDAADPKSYSTLEKEKTERIDKLMKNGSLTKPIVVHDTHTGERRLLSGNTRLTYHTGVLGKRTPVHVIRINSKDLK